MSQLRRLHLLMLSGRKLVVMFYKNFCLFLLDPAESSYTDPDELALERDDYSSEEESEPQSGLDLNKKYLVTLTG